MTVLVNARTTGAKVVLTVDASTIEYVDTKGKKLVRFQITIEGNFKYHATMPAKSYRKAIEKIRIIGLDNCKVFVMGNLIAHNKLGNAGFQVFKKSQKEPKEIIQPIIEEPIKVIKRPILSLKPKVSCSN